MAKDIIQRSFNLNSRIIVRPGVNIVDVIFVGNNTLASSWFDWDQYSVTVAMEPTHRTPSSNSSTEEGDNLNTTLMTIGTPRPPSSPIKRGRQGVISYKNNIDNINPNNYTWVEIKDIRIISFAIRVQVPTVDLPRQALFWIVGDINSLRAIRFLDDRHPL
jgi:hypothetical protein